MKKVNKQLRIYIVAMSDFVRQDGSEMTAPIGSNAQNVLTQDKKEMNPIVSRMFNEIQENIEKLEANGSGWVLEKIQQIDIHMAVYVPFVGGTYIELPKSLAKKKGVINIKNDDDMCFKYL